MPITVISSEKLDGLSLKDVGFDLILAVGGDGTFLKAFKKSVVTGRPVLCVRNESSKGVLAECELKDLTKAAKNLQGRKFSIIRYPMLEGKTESRQLFGFNEIGFFRTTEEALRFDLFINNVLFYENMVADGGVISTPAGSTAYNISAGGPVIDIASQSLVFTPLNPHGLNKPVVFEGSARIVFRRNVAHTFADGRKFGKIKKQLEVRKSASHANVISFGTSFYARWKRIVGL